MREVRYSFYIDLFFRFSQIAELEGMTSLLDLGDSNTARFCEDNVCFYVQDTCTYPLLLYFIEIASHNIFTFLQR